MTVGLICGSDAACSKRQPNGGMVAVWPVGFGAPLTWIDCKILHAVVRRI